VSHSSTPWEFPAIHQPMETTMRS
jgi:hypothetical protein